MTSIKYTVLLLTFCCIAYSEDADYIKKRFEELYPTSKEYKFQYPGSSVRLPSDSFMEIVKLGPPVVPFIIEKMEKNPDDYHFNYAIMLITMKGIERSEIPNFKKIRDNVDLTNKETAKLYVKWWKSERKNDPEKFRKYYKEWKKIDKTNIDKNHNDIYLKMKRLGISVLPNIIEEIKKGDTSLISLVSSNTRKSVKEDATIGEVVAWWEANKEDWTLPPVESLTPPPDYTPMSEIIENTPSPTATPKKMEEKEK